MSQGRVEVMATISIEQYRLKLAETMKERGRNGLQDRVRGLCLGLARSRVPGLRFYHTWDSRKSAPGFVDCVIAIPTQGRTIFAELKTQKGAPTIEQRHWLDALSATGPTFLWRPLHLLTGTIETIITNPEWTRTIQLADSGLWVMVG